MRDADYAYAVARIRSNEVKLLSRQDVEALLAVGDCEKCIGRLGDKGWGGSIGSAAETESQMLDNELRKTWALISEVTPDVSVFNFIRVKNDYHNLKAALKGRMANSEWKHLVIEPYTVEPETIAKAISEKQFELLPPEMAKAALEAYDALITWVDGQLCELILDRAALEASLAEAVKAGGLAKRLTELEVFAADVRIAYRAALMKKSGAVIKRAIAKCPAVDVDALTMACAEGVEGIQSYLGDIDKDAADAVGQGLDEFEQLVLGRQQKLLDEVKYDTLGAAPLISYFVRREREIRDVRIVLAGLRNGVPQERIRAML